MKHFLILAAIFSMSFTFSSAQTVEQYKKMEVNKEGKEGKKCKPMDKTSLANLITEMKKQSLAESKMEVAKEGIQPSCVSADQIRQLITLFDNDKDRLELAKFSVAFCSNLKKIHAVDDIFEYESSIEELDEYISGQ